MLIDPWVFLQLRKASISILLLLFRSLTEPVPKAHLHTAKILFHAHDLSAAVAPDGANFRISFFAGNDLEENWPQIERADKEWIRQLKEIEQALFTITQVNEVGENQSD